MKFLALVLFVAAASAAKESAWTRIHGKPGTPRITGGEEVEPHSVPYQVGLNIFGDDGTYFCGGSLIAENYVLTAAHCCELTSNITVVLGAHEIRSTNETTQQQIRAANVTINPGWDSTNLENDICLIKLAKAANLTEAVQIGSLASRREANDDFSGRIGTATGWGLSSDTAEQIAPTLRSVDAPIVTNLKCRQLFGIIGILLPLHASNICIDTTGGKSTCSGDSGGPLTVLTNTGKPEIVGLTSFGVAAGCEKDFPAVFTRISSFLDWIQLISGVTS